MNLDEYINHELVGTPSDMALTPGSESARQADERSSYATASAIPIKSRRDAAQPMIPQSVPVAAHQRVPEEFGYLPRQVRKTSIDETSRSVSLRADPPPSRVSTCDCVKASPLRIR